MYERNFNYYELGNRIREVREQKGYSQRTLAEKAEISVNYLSHIECGLAKFSFPILVNIINALDSTPNRILMNSVNNTELALRDEIITTINDLSLVQLDFLLKYLDLLTRYNMKKV